MGTYTTNYNLFMPTVGEQGWGDLVNGNFTTIDNTMKSLSNRLTAVESEVNGNLSCTSVTTSGKVTANGGVGTTSLTTSSTITSTGLITANGGVKGNLTGKINVSSFGTDTNNLKAFINTFNNPSKTSSTAFLTQTNLTCNAATVNKKNTSIINYTGGTSINSTCTITIGLKSSIPSNAYLYGRLYVTVVNNTSGSTVMSEQTDRLEVYKGQTVNTTKSFTRNSTNRYTISVVGYRIHYNDQIPANDPNNEAQYFSYTVSTNTPLNTGYIT